MANMKVNMNLTCRLLHSSDVAQSIYSFERVLLLTQRIVKGCVVLF